jgi:predicted amidohydrolase
MLPFASLCVVPFVLVASAFGAGNLVPNPNFQILKEGIPQNWSVWSPRPELAPQAKASGSELVMAARRFADYGKWTSVVEDISPGKHYRFDVLYRAERVASEAVSVAAMLSWSKDAAGAEAVERDYVDRIEPAGEWRCAWRTLQAPAGARSVRIELVLRWSEGGSVRWKQPRLVEVDAPRRRIVRVATTHLEPNRPATLDGNVQLMGEMLDRAGAEKADLVVLSENFVDRGVTLPLLERAQPVPGPATELLSRKAKQHGVWVVTTLLERDGGLVYNTAVVIDRTGRIAGKYRKVHLPLAEGEEGITPGSDYAVFDTDFGRIGVVTCWDNWFVEPARILRLKGAELIVFPIAGDGAPRHWDVVSRARAIDNGVYLVSSNAVGGASRIIDPDGEVLGEASGAFGLAVCEIDLDRESRLNWLSVGPSLGEGKSLYIKERRPDTYAPLAR